MSLEALHRRLAALMATCALVAFISGAGLDTPAVIPALVVLAAVAVRPTVGSRARRLEVVWKIAAIALAFRAAHAAFVAADDVVLPMVDLLLLLLVAEALRPAAAGSDGRLYSLAIALFVAGSVYRPGALFLIAFVAFVILGTVSLMVGYLARQQAAHGSAPLRLPPRVLLRTTTLAIVPLAMAALVFATFPRVSQAWVNRGVPIETSVVGFADQVSLGTLGTRIHPNPAVALRVEFPRGGAERTQPLYWRGRSYDHFDGVRWSRTRGAIVRDPARNAASAVADIEQLIYGVPLSSPVLFGLPTIADIVPRSRIRPLREPGNDFGYVGLAAPVYSVFSSTSRPDAAALRAVDYVVPAAFAGYLQLPPMSTRMLALARSLGAEGVTAYDRVRSMERWFHEQFRYTLELPRTARDATLDHFLFERRAGHCEYFSTAMVVLLRAQGIAARNVNGFLGGEWNEIGDFLTVTQNQAHSWVEVWFPGHGWVTFDPTPAALGDLAARVPQGWIARLRHLAAGFDHRWGKWVLDYDVQRQMELLQRTVDAFAEPPAGDSLAPVRARWVGAVLLALLVAYSLLRLLPRLPRRDTSHEVTRAYLRLCRAYEKAGYEAARHAPPLRVAAGLRFAGAPGADAADAAIRRYVHMRFGGREPTSGELDRLKSDVRAATAQLREARRRVGGVRTPAADRRSSDAPSPRR